MNELPAVMKEWLLQQGISLLDFQQAAWSSVLHGESGLINAPTGTGKTFAVWLPLLSRSLGTKRTPGLKIVWITPLRALAKDTARALQESAEQLKSPWKIELRTSDTSSQARKRQRLKPPDVLVTTPESLHILLSYPGAHELFANVQAFVVDEWHELVGSKRGVQVELALAYLRSKNSALQTWGISATIGNVADAMKVLLGKDGKGRLIKSSLQKTIHVETVMPDSVERFPWAGHLGIRMIDKVVPLIEQSRTTLLFTNTRSQTEIWYQRLLEEYPELAGQVATHHGSLDQRLREWVEQALHQGKLKLVVCTSSLDLGVDFRPVETVVQVGSPKGLARLVQRAGRSGHQPGATSVVYFVPTHALELLESLALQEGLRRGIVEDRVLLQNPIDVLLQYVVTRACGDGVDPEKLFEEVKTCTSYAALTQEEWQWILAFVTHGGESLKNYDDYHKVVLNQGLLRVADRAIALRHRLSIGTIVSDASLQVKYLRGGSLGTVEESFVTRMKPGDVFWLGGKCLELISIREVTVYVKKAKAQRAMVPRWMGGRMPLSSQVSQLLREVLSLKHSEDQTPERQVLEPLLELQRRWSAIPTPSELLVETWESKEGFHLFVYPFDGRAVHEGVGTLVAQRLSQEKPLSFSIAMNDYGFELLSDSPFDVSASHLYELLSPDRLEQDIMGALNSAEMARRRFHEIARVAGLVFFGYPGAKKKTEKHLIASSRLFFDVFTKYDPDNLLLVQAFEESLQVQFERKRLENALRRMQSQTLKIKPLKRPSPFAFPIMVDRLREKVSSERIEDRVRKMQAELERWADKK